jgi:CRISPR-associated endonuclease/helicase Cas3
MTLYAHQGQPLAEHLKNVGEFAARFAAFFGAAEHGRLAGLLHDLGKAEEQFQSRITNGTGEKQPHAHHGAALLLEKDADRGGPVLPVAFAINAHHAGLHDRHDLQSRVSYRERALAAEKWLSEAPEWNGTAWPVGDFGKNLPDWLEELPFSAPDERTAKLRAVDLYTRFLFSALIDADRLDTERHSTKTGENFGKRHNWRFGLEGLAAEGAPVKLLDLLESAIKERRKKAESGGVSPDVLEVRAEVLRDCDSAAGKPRGVFTLTVPTGGGKTLASVYFALRHISAQNQTQGDPYQKLRRIIVVIPYLNIIQQTAEELKDVFRHVEEGPVVLEHHSQAQDPPTPSEKQGAKVDTDGYSRERTLRQLAAENWDAPIVVTTSVQFFDSLFSRRPADARKLHNIAQSVIIFDEVQTFPPRLMQPILDVLGEITNPERPYRCSLVLCTATQPALIKSADLPYGFTHAKEIIEKPQDLFLRLKRTTYPEIEAEGPIPTQTWPQLAYQVLNTPSVQGLVVVNTRRHARELFEELRKSDQHRDAVFHLSTWMTAAHRVEVLKEVTRRLDAREPCFLVSTQCIEAGADVDFPAVWRAFGPYDAIVQAAGRCNRNGRMKPEEAQVHVFRPEDGALPPGVYRTAASQTELLCKMHEANPRDPKSFDTYFRLLYQLSVPDECEIQREREQLHFKQVDERFNFIESFSTPIVITEYELPSGRVNLWELAEHATRKRFLTPEEWSSVQPHMVQLDYRDRKTAQFNQTATAPIFPEDDKLTGLRRLTHFSAYDGGLYGCGLDAGQIGRVETVL